MARLVVTTRETSYTLDDMSESDIQNLGTLVQSLREEGKSVPENPVIEPRDDGSYHLIEQPVYG